MCFQQHFESEKSNERKKIVQEEEEEIKNERMRQTKQRQTTNDNKKPKQDALVLQHFVPPCLVIVYVPARSIVKYNESVRCAYLIGAVQVLTLLEFVLEVLTVFFGSVFIIVVVVVVVVRVGDLFVCVGNLLACVRFLCVGEVGS